MIEMSEVRLYVTGDERLLRHVGVSDFLLNLHGGCSGSGELDG